MIIRNVLLYKQHNDIVEQFVWATMLKVECSNKTCELAFERILGLFEEEGEIDLVKEAYESGFRN